MKVIYEKPKVFTDSVTTYCGGCGHGIVGKDVEDTIRHVGVLAAQGMRETDRVILKIMTE